MKTRCAFLFKPLKNKRGMLMIEYVMSFMIIVMLISFLYDLTLVVVQRNRAMTVLQSMARVVQVQSGIEPTRPTYFPTTGDSYLRSSVFMQRATALLEGTGIDSTGISIEITGTNLSGSSVTEVVDAHTDLQLKYKTPFTIKLTYEHQFTLWAQFIPGLERVQQEITTVGLAEYKQNFDNWEGE